MSSPPPRVVVLGAGVAGLEVALLLELHAPAAEPFDAGPGRRFVDLGVHAMAGMPL